MKNKIRYLLALVLLTVLFSCAAAAKDSGEIYLKAQGNDVSIYLNLPEGQEKEVTSIHFKLYIDIEEGALDEEKTSFEFSDALASEVKSAVHQRDGSEYSVDIVLSGKERILNQITNDAAGLPLGTFIGTLKLVPKEDSNENSRFLADVSLMLEDDANDSIPVVEYVVRGSAQTVKSRITTAETVYVGQTKDIARDCTISLTPDKVVYNKQEWTPEVKVADGVVLLTKGEDYEVSYSNNLYAGLGVAVVTGKGEYGGSKYGYFDIAKAEKPDNTPDNTILLKPNSVSSLKDVPLPDFWEWEEPDTPLASGETVSAYAVYTKVEDRESYETVRVQIAVSMQEDTPPVTPENPDEPAQPDTQPQQPDTQPQSETQQPETGAGESTQTVQNLTAQPVVGTKKVKLSWDRVSGADGYEVRVLDAETGKYKKAKTISKGDKTTYTGTYTFGEKLTFKVRAYTLDADGKTKKFGAYSKTVEVQASVFDETVHPEMSAATKNGKKKVTLSWDAIKGADGYRIYLWHEDTQTYSRLAEITKGKTHTYKDAVSFQYGQRYKVKMRAYALDAGGKKKAFSKFSKVLSFKVPPAQVKDVSLKAAGGKVEVSWSKVDGAQGYRVFRSTSVSGGYVRIGSAWGEDALKYTDTTAKSGNTYYYKVKAFARNPQKQRILGRMSAAKSVTVK